MKKLPLYILIVVILGGAAWYAVGNHHMDNGMESPMPSMDMSSMTPGPTVTPTSSIGVVTHTPTPTKTPGIIIHETEVFNVSISNFAFSPASVQVTKGDVVVFKNNDATRHTVTSDTEAFDSGILDAGEQFTLQTANMAPGTYQFHCGFHSSMRGTVVVH